MTRSSRLLAGAAVALCAALSACTQDVPITTAADRTQREISKQLDIGAVFGTDVVLLLEQDERAAAVTAVHRQLRELVLGDADGDGVADHGGATLVRVTVLSEAELRAIATPNPDFPGWWSACAEVGCVPVERVATYRWQPYGFAPSFDTFLAQVDCLLSDDPAACIPDDATRAGRSFLDAGGFGPTADDLSRPSLPTTIFDECIGDYVAWGLGPDDGLDAVRFDDDGRAQCEVLETLPRSGPITRCAQLADFGRSFDHVDDDGREVCAIAQVLTDAAGEPDSGHGFYVYDGARGEPSVLSFLPVPTPTPAFPPGCSVITSDGLHVLMKDNTPFVTPASVASHCTLEVAEQ